MIFPGLPGEGKFNPQILAGLFDAESKNDEAKNTDSLDSPATSPTQTEETDSSSVEINENLENSYDDDLQRDAPLPAIQSRNLYEKVVEFHYKLQMILAPNGTKQFPAKTCYDLFLNYPEKISGNNFKNFKQIKYIFAKKRRKWQGLVTWELF